jgi:hypothetical protein
MKHFVLLSLFSMSLASSAIAADFPKADDAFRAEQVKKYSAACVKGIEDKPDLRVRYSHQTVEAYCACRQRYAADVYAQAIKQDRRGKAVEDEATNYAQEKCVHILLKQLEHE